MSKDAIIFRTAVVIPFFQRNAGILSGTVHAALAQKGIQDFEIIVVDDCSPIPAMKELSGVMADFPGRIRIIQMDKNSGQGAARNKGMESVRPETEFVAFLDSDDQWSDTHLYNALFALEQGYDFYFSDFYQLHQTVSAFNRAKRINPSEHERVAGSDSLYKFQLSMFNQIIMGNVLGMSTIVYRFRKFPDVRFREEFRSTGEEYIFWLDLAQLTNRIVFSAANECRYGEGVNTYSGAMWGKEGAIQKLHDEIKYLRYILTQYSLEETQRRHVLGRIKDLRVGFVEEVLHRITHRKPINPKVCLSLVKMDRPLILLAVPISLKVLYSKVIPDKSHDKAIS
jgi:succinoglycan biosynthesis protein ExoW